MSVINSTMSAVLSMNNALRQINVLLPLKVVMTDVDGSLLEHRHHSSTQLKQALNKLDQQGMPVVFCSCKTATEMQLLRRQIPNNHPFIVENGAAIHIPQRYFIEDIDVANFCENDCDVFTFSRPRRHWQRLLTQLKPRFKGLFTSVNDMAITDLIALTGLSVSQLHAASQRRFTELVVWQGSISEKTHFIAELHEIGANVTESGHFLLIGGNHNKGRALQWLAERYRFDHHSVTSIAASDSDHDQAMLEAADRALIIRSDLHPPPQLQRKDNVWISAHKGPIGWAETLPQLINRY